MNTENSGRRSEGMSPSDIHSSVSGSNELMPVKLITEIAAMDYEMKTLENKAKSKLEEERQLLEAKNSNLASLSSVRKQLILLQDRELSFSRSLNRVKDSNTALEGLELAVIQNLKAIKISNDEQRSRCNNVIQKYSTIISSHRESFNGLPWVKEKKLLSVAVEKKRVILDTLKMQQKRNKAKLRQLEEISEKCQRIEILRLSSLMIQREKCLRTVGEKDTVKRMVEQEIRSLEQQKCLLEEKIVSRTQEMILRIMNRSSDKQDVLPAPNEMRINIDSRDELNKSTTRSIKDRLGIGKRQLSHGFTSIEPRQAIEDGVTETKSLLTPSTKTSFSHVPEREATRSSFPTCSKGDTAQSMEIDSYKNTTAAIEVEQSSEIRDEPMVQNSVLPAPLQLDVNPVFSEKPTPIPAGIPSHPPSLKAILKPSSSQSKLNESSLNKEDVPAVSNAIKHDELVTCQTPSSQNTVIQPQDLCGDVCPNKKRSTDDDCGDRSKNVMGAPAPKRPRMSQKMPPPRPTSASLRQQKKSNQTPKRVSFVSNDEENWEDESTSTKGSSCNLGTPTPKMNSDEYSQKQIEPANKCNEPVDVSTKTSPPQRPSAQQDDVVCQPSEDKFRPPFSPSPQPFSTPQQQATPGNFDSIFGAIFNTPGTSKDNDGFQFNMQGDAGKQNISNEGANTSSNPGQDFFSFFGTPNAKEDKKSYTDNFFKLF